VDVENKVLCKYTLKEKDLSKLRDAIEDLYYFEFVIGKFAFLFVVIIIFLAVITTDISLHDIIIIILSADRTATQYDRLLASSCHPSVCPSVCLSVTLCIVALGAGVLG